MKFLECSGNINNFLESDWTIQEIFDSCRLAGMDYDAERFDTLRITFDEKTSLLANRLVLTDNKEDTSAIIWPSGICLALYLHNNVEIMRDKFVIELGAGAALPAQICERYANKVIIQDRVKFYSNHLPTIISDWNSELAMRFNGQVDLILGADVTYDDASFGPLMALISMIMKKDEGICVLAHQDRNIHSTLEPYLKLFSLKTISCLPFLDAVSSELLVKFLGYNPNLEDSIHAPIFIITIAHCQ